MIKCQQSLNFVVSKLKSLLRACQASKTRLLFSCVLVLSVVILLSSICSLVTLAMLRKEFAHMLLNRRGTPWTRTSDAREKCIKSQWNLPLFYKNGNISCNLLEALSCNEILEVFSPAELESPNWPVTCPRRSRLAPVRLKLPKTGLASYPGSGNTWVRHLLQQLTGIQTGSLYKSDQLLKGEFPGEGKEERVIAVKTHLTAIENTRNVYFSRQILILRNPFNSFVAEYKRGTLKAGHTQHINISVNEEWLSYVDGEIRAWSYFVRFALSFPNPQIIIMYEDMKECLLRELLSLAAFLRAPTFNKFSFCCALINSQGRSYRNQPPAPLPTVYPELQTLHMNEMLTTLAYDVERYFPVLAERLLDYRLIAKH